MKKITEWLEAQPRAAGVHVSDLLNPRKAFWKRKDPQPMTEDEAGYFIAGRGHHQVIEAIIAGSDLIQGSTPTDSGTHEWEGIHYSPDMKTPHPLEIKTSRSKRGPSSDNERALKAEYEGYLDQLTAYQAIDGDTQGHLLVFYLNLEQPNGRSKPRFRWYDVEMTPEEIGRRQAQLLATKKQLELALTKKGKDRHRALPLCAKWMCRDCAWLDKCQPWRDDETRTPPEEKRRERL